MICDLYPDGAQAAIKHLVQRLIDESLTIHEDDRLDLEQFISDLQQALDDEAERQYIVRTTY